MTTADGTSFDRFVEEQRRTGSGPALLFNLQVVDARCRAIANLASACRARFLHAIKSFPDPRVLGFLAARGTGFDASNAAELALLRSAGIEDLEPRPFVSLTGPLAHRALPDPLVSIVNVDSRDQWNVVQRLLAPEQGVGVRLASRRRTTRFGLDPDARALLSGITCHPAFRGAHVHDGDDKSADDVIAAARVARRAMESIDAPLASLNLGGGLDCFGLAELYQVIATLRAELPSTELIFEPGSWWFGGAGYALAEVLTIAEVAGSDCFRVVVDLSLDCHLRWSEPRLIHTAEGGEPSRVLFVGPSCHEGDVLGLFELPRRANGQLLVEVGERLLWGGISPYAVAWNCSFNGVPEARVLLHGID